MSTDDKEFRHINTDFYHKISENDNDRLLKAARGCAIWLSKIMPLMFYLAGLSTLFIGPWSAGLFLLLVIFVSAMSQTSTVINTLVGHRLGNEIWNHMRQ